MVCGESTRPERPRPPKPTPPRPLTPEPEPIPLPTPTPAPKPPPTRARKPPRRSTKPNFEARSSSSRPSSKTPCGKDVRNTVLSAPKGAYLEGYGAVFSTEASLYRIRIITPFSRRPYSQEELDEAHRAALERLEGLKVGLRQAVAEHGSLLGQLKPDHTLAVIVHLYNGVADPRRPYPSQLIFKARAGSVNDYREGRITMEELVRQVRISQF